MQETGKVVNVVHRRIGTTLDGDHPAGSTTLLVVNPVEFSDSLATLELPDETTAAYTGIDDDTNHILLAEATVEDYADGDRIWVLPAAIDATAEVSDEEGGSVSVTIPHDSIDKLHEGPRDPGTEETVTYESSPEGGWVLVNVDKEIPVRDASFDDPDTASPPQPVDPWGPAPDDAPVLAAVPFAIGAVRGAWGPVERAQTYEVFASLTPGIDVDTATPVGSISGTRFDIASLDGVLLPMGEGEAPVFMRVRAVNPNGAGPASNEASATARQADNEFISSLYAYFGTVELSQLKSTEIDAVVAILGQLAIGDDSLIEIKPPSVDGEGNLVGGIIIKDPVNPDSPTPLVRLHPNGCTFQGKVTTDVLTVLEEVEITLSATFKSNSVATLKAGGVADPTVAPSLASGPVTDITVPTLAGYTHRALTWDATSEQYYQLLTRDSDKGPRLRAISTSGVPVDGSLVALDLPPDYSGSGWTLQLAAGLAISGSYAFWVHRTYQTGDSAYDVLVKSTLAGDFTAQVNYTSESGVTSIPGRPAVCVEGSNVLVAGPTGTSNSGVKMWSLTLSGGDSQARLGDLPSSTAFVGFHAGASDFSGGATRMIVFTATEARVYPYTSDNATVSATASETWPTGATVTAGFYKGSGTDPGFRTLTGTTLQAWTAYYPSSDGTWAARYTDTGVGTTKASPISSTITVGKRHAVTIALPPAPSGVTGADVWVGYANGVTPATFYKRPESAASRTVTLRTKDISGTTTLPATNTLGTGSPAELKSEAGGFSARGDGKVTVRDPQGPTEAVNKQTLDAAWRTAAQPHIKRDASTTQSLTSGSVTKITTFGTVVDASTKIDNGTDDDIAYTTGDFTVRLAGIYMLAVNIRYTGSATNIRSAYIYKNGSTLLKVEQSGAVTASAYDASANVIARLAAGDVVSFSGLQNTGGSLSTVATGTTASVTRLAA